MPQRPQNACNQPGCGKACDGPFCSDHKKENHRVDARRKYDRDRKNDPTYRMYTDSRYGWEKFKQALAGHGNVICQRLVNGVRCTTPTAIRHHIISPKFRPDLFTVPGNVVGVCRLHHSDEIQDDPKLYVPTLWRAPYVGGPLPENVPEPKPVPVQMVETTKEAEPLFVVSSVSPQQAEDAAADTAKALSALDRIKSKFRIA
jgi:hypothetical protein